MMSKKIGKLYWCPEQEAIVELLNINTDSIWPYNYKYIDCDETDYTDVLLDKGEALEEIADLESKIESLKDYVDTVKKGEGSIMTNIKIGSKYYDSEQQCVVKVFEIDNEENPYFPYLVGDLDSTGDDNPLCGDAYWTDKDSLWGEEEILEELRDLRLEMTLLNNALDLLRKGI